MVARVIEHACLDSQGIADHEVFTSLFEIVDEIVATIRDRESWRFYCKKYSNYECKCDDSTK